MAAANSDGEVNELNVEVARSEVNEMGDAMATASGGGEASEPIGEAAMEDDEPKKKRRQRAKGWKTGNERRRQQRQAAAEAAAKVSDP